MKERMFQWKDTRKKKKKTKTKQLRPQDPKLPTFHYQCDCDFELSFLLCRMRAAMLSLGTARALDNALKDETGGRKEETVKERERKQKPFY